MSLIMKFRSLWPARRGFQFLRVLFVAIFLIAGGLVAGFSRNTMESPDNLVDKFRTQKLQGKHGVPQRGWVRIEWIDESRGEAVARLFLEAAALSRTSTWKFKWTLPEKVFSDAPLNGPMMENANQNQVFVLEIPLRGLNSSMNQNILIEIIPESPGQKGLSFLIPSRVEKTLEYETEQNLAPSSEELQKMETGEKKRSPRIRF